MSSTRIDQMRQNYTLGGLLEKDVHADPMVQFGIWFDEATGATVKNRSAGEQEVSGLPAWLEPNAMTLSTASLNGEVASRTVLLKGVEENAFVFYSNYGSNKASHIDANPNVALCFYWPHLQRQVLVQGVAAKINRDRSGVYFRSRPRDSQLGAHASVQSSMIESREILEQTMDALRLRYPEGTEIPLPENWGGYAVTPVRVEFWQGRTSRLHDRIVYRKPDHSRTETAAGGGLVSDAGPNAGPNDGTAWSIERLSP